jgi:hypothetical protein
MASATAATVPSIMAGDLIGSAVVVFLGFVTFYAGQYAGVAGMAAPASHE